MIYIVSHKRVRLPLLRGYKPLQVGFAPDDFPGFLRDNTGDSIADRNGGYCELTGMYWIWKNTADDFKGLAHYRRYFGRRPFSSDLKDILGYDELCGMLADRDIVVARPTVYHCSAREQMLMECCSPDTFDKLRAVMAELHPDCMDAFDRFFSGNRASQYNMLFCRRALFDAYCAWLFPVLFTLEDRVDLRGADDYRKRLYGFLGERLLNVWILRNGLKARHVPVISTEYSLGDHLTYLRRDITNDIRFHLRGRNNDHRERAKNV